MIKIWFEVDVGDMNGCLFGLFDMMVFVILLVNLVVDGKMVEGRWNGWRF